MCGTPFGAAALPAGTGDTSANKGAGDASRRCDRVMIDQIYWFAIGALGVWRLTHALHAEDGPGGTLRESVSGLAIGAIFDRFYCLSLWTALPIAWLIADSAAKAILLWLGLSGAACLFERLTGGSAEPSPIVFTKMRGDRNGLL